MYFSTELSTGSVDHCVPAQGGLIMVRQLPKLSFIQLLIN